MEEFFIIIRQTFQFCILMLIGIIAVKCKVLDEKGLSYMVKFLMKIAMPLMLFTNMVGSVSQQEVVSSFSIIFIGAVLIVVLFGLGWLIAQAAHLKGNEKSVYKALFCFENIGCIGIPMIMALFPERGAIYISMFTIAHELLLWTLGMKLTTPVGGAGKSIGKSLLNMVNPALVAILAGFVCVWFGWTLPSVVDSTLTSVGNVTTSLVMVYIGGLFCYSKIGHAFLHVEFYLIVIVKMILIPILVFMLLNHLSFGRELSMAMAIFASLPCMTSVAMFAKANGSAGEYAVGAVLLTTLAGIGTIPLVGYVLTLL